MVQKEYKSNRQCHVDWRIYETPVQNLRFNNFDNDNNLQIMTLLGQVHNLNKSELECLHKQSRESVIPLEEYHCRMNLKLE